MIHGKLLPVGAQCFALVYPTNDPEMLLPIRGTVVDVVMDPDLPFYVVKPVWAYENIDWLRRYFHLGSWKHLDLRSRMVEVPPAALASVQDFNTWLADHKSFKLRVEYPFVFKDKTDMLLRFHRLQDYLIARDLRRLQVYMTRREYRGGRWHMDSRAEWLRRVRTGFIDKFEGDADYERWMDMTSDSFSREWEPGSRHKKGLRYAKLRGRRGKNSRGLRYLDPEATR